MTIFLTYTSRQNAHYVCPFERLKLFGCHVPSVCHPFMIVGILFKQILSLVPKKFYPFQWLLLFMRKTFSSIGMAEVICSKKPSSVKRAKTICLKKMVIRSKKSAAVRTADVIHLKETALLRTANVSRLGNSFQLFKQLLLSLHTKLISRSVGQQYMMGFKFPNRWDYLFRRNFIQLSEWLCSFETKSQPI